MKMPRQSDGGSNELSAPAMQPEARITPPLSLVAAIPGTYTGPASRAYLYYTGEDKQWVDGLRVEIKPLG